MRRLVLIGVATFALLSPAALAKQAPTISEVEADMEMAYVFDVPQPLLDVVLGDPAGYSITADCWQPRRRVKRWGCELTYELGRSDETLTCVVAGRAWMTRRGLQTYRASRERCDG